MKHDKLLRDALTHAYYNVDELKKLVHDELDVQLATIVNTHAPLETVVFDLLVWAEAAGRLGELVWAAYGRQPNNPKLGVVVAGLQPGVAPYGKGPFAAKDWKRLAAEADGGLEKIVLEGIEFENVAPWLEKLGRSFRRVCRVEPQPEVESRSGYGSGFLVADDVVMTNSHVVQGFEKRGPASVRFRFDYAVDVEGVTAAGRTTSLAKSWEILRSPAAELDFALIRLAEPVGKDDVHGSPRGHLELHARAFTRGEPLLILQHPDALPLKLALGSVTQPDHAGNRVGYNTNTLSGSSGSPCFTTRLQAVAIHHYGADDHNRGVRFDAIGRFLALVENRQRLADAGLAGLLNSTHEAPSEGNVDAGR